MLAETLEKTRKAVCTKGYAIIGGKCLAMELPDKFFCICNGLMSAAGYQPNKSTELYTVGALASLVDKITSVADLMTELVEGKKPAVS